MKSEISSTYDEVVFRHPKLEDGYEIYQLIQRCPPLDLNSSYLYFLQADHFADTCLIAEYQGKLVGFISGYRHPKNKQQLFVWQVAVDASMRGKKVASQLLEQLVVQQVSDDITSITSTISPSNLASQKLFKRFAERYELSISNQPYLLEQHFGSLGHEAEELYLISSLDKQPLKPIIKTKSKKG